MLDIGKEATGIEALATSRLVLEALQALGLKKLVVLSPYRSNQAVIDYLKTTGFSAVHDVALGLKSLEFADVPPREWTELARQHDRPEADGIFLSCTNTTQIEAVADIEQRAGQAGGQQQPSRALGLCPEIETAARPVVPDAGARPAHGANGCVTG